MTGSQTPDNNTATLSRVENANGYTVTETTAMGKATSYAVQELPTGGELRTTVDAAGLTTTTKIGADGSQTVTGPDGSIVNYAPGPDPRFGMAAPIPSTYSVKMPSGLTSSMSESSAAVLSDPASPLSLVKLIRNTTINGNTYTSIYDATTRTLTKTTPQGRSQVVSLDARGRVTQVQSPGITPISYSYDSRGRLATIGQGSRTTTYAYDSLGNLASITDSLNQTTSYLYDLAGRVTQETLPDNSVIGISYDKAGNLTSVTPPGQPAHQFSYTPLNDLKDSNPPVLGSGATPTHYSYNNDGQLTGIARPDGSTVNLGYDGAGRLSGVTIARGTTSYGYSGTTGNLTSVTAPDGGALGYSYDGSLLTGSTAANGVLAATLGYSYDSSFRLTGQTLNGGGTVSYRYDGDSLLTGAGAMSLSYDPGNGLFTGSTLGSTTDSLAYNGFGEPSSYIAQSGASTLFSEQYTRDGLGRISTKVQTVNGTTHTYGYSYDRQGRLTDVSVDSTPTTHYSYDANGNRLTASGETGFTGTAGGSYDAQDRLTHYGNFTYSYTANGELASKTDTSNSNSTSYTYDALDNLTNVTLPDGTSIDYLIDGANRRIGKKVNGSLQQGFLYDDNALDPVALTDSSGAVTARFTYAGGANVPAYMVKGAATYRIITDQVGSVRLVVDSATGAIAQRIDYDEFGNVTSDSNPGFQPFGFAGGLYDAQTGLVRFGARDYDPATGRWAVQDPAGFAAGQANLYGYVLDDPINASDPSGLGWNAGSDLVGQLLPTAEGAAVLAARPIASLVEKARELQARLKNRKAELQKLLKACPRDWAAIAAKQAEILVLQLGIAAAKNEIKRLWDDYTAARQRLLNQGLYDPSHDIQPPPPGLR